MRKLRVIGISFELFGFYKRINIYSSIQVII
jgi:hypothetical protein